MSDWSRCGKIERKITIFYSRKEAAGFDPRSVIVLDPGESWQFYR